MIENILNKAVFLDRDGVIIEDTGFISKVEQIKMYSYTPKAIKLIKEMNYKIFVVTNQTVISRGFAKEQDVENIHKYIDDIIYKKSGVRIDKFYYCPHHPEATLEDYRVKCNCRKPKPGMILNAAKEHNIDLSKSYMIGDRISDIIAGNKAGTKTILVKTGRHTEKPIVSDEIDFSIKPDYICDNLLDAVKNVIIK